MARPSSLKQDILKDIPEIGHPRANALRNGAGQLVSIPVVLWHKGQKVLQAEVKCPPSSAALYLPALQHVLAAMTRAGVKTQWDEASFLREDVRFAKDALAQDSRNDRLAAFISLHQGKNIPFALARDVMLKDLAAIIKDPGNSGEVLRERIDISLAGYEAALHVKYAAVESADIPQKRRMRWPLSARPRP